MRNTDFVADTVKCQWTVEASSMSLDLTGSHDTTVYIRAVIKGGFER